MRCGNRSVKTSVYSLFRRTKFLTQGDCSRINAGNGNQTSAPAQALDHESNSLPVGYRAWLYYSKMLWSRCSPPLWSPPLWFHNDITHESALAKVGIMERLRKIRWNVCTHLRGCLLSILLILYFLLICNTCKQHKIAVKNWFNIHKWCLLFIYCNSRVNAFEGHITTCSVEYIADDSSKSVPWENPRSHYL